MLKAYDGATVLITGHTGFKGSWLSLWLRKLGANVVGYSIGLPSSPCLFDVADIASNLVHVQGDIRNQYLLDEIFCRYQPRFVFHLAAQPLVRLSYAEPIETFETNVIGTLRVLEAARRCPSVQAIINVTSDKCYENREWVWGYRENDPMGGHDPYSASKGCAELATAAYRRSFFVSNEAGGRLLGLASARAGNVIGGGDWGMDRLVPDCIVAFHRGESVVLRHPDAVRPWQHVLEPLSGYLKLGAHLISNPKRWSGGWNFGPTGQEIITVGQLVESLARRWGDGKWTVESGHKLHEARWLKLDISKAHIELDWTPRLSFKQSLDMTAHWYKSYYNNANSVQLRHLIEEQIEFYDQLV